jgi:hypothetical protein
MVSSARILFTWGRRRFGEKLADLETVYRLVESAQGNRKYKERVLGQKAHVLAYKWCREPDLGGGMKRLRHNGVSPHHPNHSY